MAKVIEFDLERRFVVVEYPWGDREKLDGLSYDLLYGKDAKTRLVSYILDVQRTRAIDRPSIEDRKMPIEPSEIQGKTFDDELKIEDAKPMPDIP